MYIIKEKKTGWVAKNVAPHAVNICGMEYTYLDKTTNKVNEIQETRCEAQY
jgi:hypothetical protein